MCAIHQPNLFPRLSTLAKLYAADRWIVLGDVRSARRDDQHRARLAALDESARQQWLTLPTHLPDGRRTLISQARLADPGRSRRTAGLLIRQCYGRSRHWAAVREVLEAVLHEFEATDRVSDVARASTVALLTASGWSGEVLDGSAIPTREGRSERLADLAAAPRSTRYLCGTGGRRYLDTKAFDARGIQVLSFRTPAATGDPLWRWARQTSSLWAISGLGPTAFGGSGGSINAHKSSSTIHGRVIAASRRTESSDRSRPTRHLNKIVLRAQSQTPFVASLNHSGLVDVVPFDADYHCADTRSRGWIRLHT
ncbi:WbqC family protein [Streptomyces sp. NPDC048281]|uniref:WbqC family protein n=1 Tax=Streptomyces sp. NPDC048281 TaxID=3154715 RepID=UPI003443B24C